MSKSKVLIAASLAVAGVLGAGVAQARDDVQWSVTIGSSAPAVAVHAPVYHHPVPVHPRPHGVYIPTRHDVDGDGIPNWRDRYDNRRAVRARTRVTMSIATASRTGRIAMTTASSAVINLPTTATATAYRTAATVTTTAADAAAQALRAPRPQGAFADARSLVHARVRIACDSRIAHTQQLACALQADQLVARVA